MRFFYPFALLILATAGSSQAQDLRPFRAGLTYQYHEAATAGDTTHTLRLDSGGRVGADSVFRFNAMVRKIARISSNCNATYQQRADNLFGATLTVKASSEFVLTAVNGRSCALRPRQAVGQPWLAIAPGITGQVTAKNMAPVFGQPDSVVTISLSNGAILQLSKRFGLLSGPSLLAYLDGRYPLRQLEAAALPGRHSIIDAQAIFDFQPGDVFLRHTRIAATNGPLCTEDWTRDSIISRTSNSAGDTIRYSVLSRNMRVSHNFSGLLTPYCSMPPGVRISQATIDMPIAIHGGFDMTTAEFKASPMFSGGTLSLKASRSPARYNGRLERDFIWHEPCPWPFRDSLYLREQTGYQASNRFALGLGNTFTKDIHSLGADYTTVLLGYSKGSERWGQLSTFAQLLPTTVARPAASTAAFPNPFAAELSVSFELDRPQPVAAELRDALGRVVLAQAAAPFAAGSRQLQLNTAAVAPGLYTLVLKPAAGPAQMLKVLKTQ